jgi:hypothetical protein
MAAWSHSRASGAPFGLALAGWLLNFPHKVGEAVGQERWSLTGDDLRREPLAALERVKAMSGIRFNEHLEAWGFGAGFAVKTQSPADSDEAGHAFQCEAGHLFRSEAGRGSDLMSATVRRASAGRWNDVFLCWLGQMWSGVCQS